MLQALLTNSCQMCVYGTDLFHTRVGVCEMRFCVHGCECLFEGVCVEG